MAAAATGYEAMAGVTSSECPLSNMEGLHYIGGILVREAVNPVHAARMSRPPQP